MSEESVIVATVLIVLLLGAAAFLGIVGGRRRNDNDKQEAPLKEPVFSNRTDATEAAAVEVEKKEKTPQLDLPLSPPFPLPDLPAPHESLLTADICYVIHFYGEEALTAAAFAPLTESLSRLHATVYRLLGYDESAGEWKHSLADSFRYWLVAVPLANRGGHLNEEGIKSIGDDARRFAQKLRLYPVFPPLAESLEKARLLDNFCHTVDMVLEFRVTCAAALTLERVEQVAATQRLTPHEGQYIYRADSESLFHVRPATTGNTVRLLTFMLDAPKVSSPERAFDSMIHCIRKISGVTDGAFTDPNGNPVSDERINEIRRQLSVLRQQMSQYGVIPGSMMAHLLFS